MAEKPKAVYDESKIKTLSSLEHIRLRTGMYIGRIGSGAHPDDGCYVMLKEVVDNAIDEYIMGHGKEVEITIDGNKVSVRDYGRGIPLGKIVDCVSKINTGAKYNEKVFRQRVDGFCSDAIQADAELKNLVVVFCAGIYFGNAVHDLAERDAAAVIAHGHLVAINRDLHVLAVAHDVFVHGIINHLFEHYIAAVIRVRAAADAPDIHSGAETNVFER